MLFKLSYIILILNTYMFVSDCASLSTRNNTFITDLIKSQYAELRSEVAAIKLDQAAINSNISTEQEREEKMIDDIKSELVPIKSELVLIKTEHALMKSIQAALNSITTDQKGQEKLLNDINSEQVLIRTELALIKTELATIKSDQKQQEKDLHNIEQLVYGHNCAEAAAKSNQSGIYHIIIPSYSNSSFNVSCDMDTRGGNWTIILKRQDGSVNFTRNWDAYKNGFGDIDGEFFLGLDKIHALTADGNQELLVLLEDFEGDKRYETYEEFAIADEQELYALKTLGKANGTAGDELRYHYGQQFSTPDRDNKDGCAKGYSACWWYKSCGRSQLTGAYKDNTYGKGILWIEFRGLNYSLKRAVMLIRPRNFSS